MRNIWFIILVITLGSCKKENLSEDSDYQNFIGKWESPEGNNKEKVSVDFLKKGKIVIKFDLERTIYFTPHSSEKYVSNYSTAEGLFWDQYYFYKDKALKGGSLTFLINPTKDTISSPRVNIENFFYENMGPISILTKQ